MRPGLAFCLALVTVAAARPAGAQDVVVPDATQFPERGAWLTPEGYVLHSVSMAERDPGPHVTSLVTLTEVRVPLGPFALRSSFGGALFVVSDPDAGFRSGHLFSPELGLETDLRGSNFRIVLGASSNVPVGAAEVQESVPMRAPFPIADETLIEFAELELRQPSGGWDARLVPRDTWVGRLSMAAEVNLDPYVVVGAEAGMELWIGLGDGAVTGGFTSRIEAGARFWGASLAGLRSMLVLRPTGAWYGAGDLEPVFGLEPFLRLVPPAEPIAPLIELSTFADLTSELRELTVRAALGMVF